MSLHARATIAHTVFVVLLVLGVIGSSWLIVASLVPAALFVYYGRKADRQHRPFDIDHALEQLRVHRKNHPEF